MKHKKDTELHWKGKNGTEKGLIGEEGDPSLKIIEINKDPRIRTKRWKNKLILGDNLGVMKALQSEFNGKIDLIYIDPPFGTGESFDYQIFIGEKVKEFSEKQKVVRKRAYKDFWGKGLNIYLQMIYERLKIMKELLAEEGSIFVHLDRNVSHYVKLLLDEIFGPKQLKNEIIWCYGGGGAPKKHYSRKHDTIFWYVKGKRWTFNKQFRPYTQGTLERGCTQVKGNYSLDDRGAGLDDWWADSDVQKILSPTAYENVKFETQKPEGLLKRIILGHSNPGDLVADFFMGSGTTVAVAEKLNRRWIGCDNSKQAIHIVRKRMFELSNTYDLFSESEQKKFYSQEIRPFEILSFEPNNQATDVSNKPNFEIELNNSGKEVIITLNNFSDNYKEILPTEIYGKIDAWTDWIDYWAIDYTNKNELFKPEWYSYRTIKDRSLKLHSTHHYNTPGTYTIMIKVIDILANEITQSHDISIK